ncbi:phosphoribosylformylglycinamidine synthase subunit PurL [Candidatus Uhrbacteria bacterium]|nr:phosphoribosylformylglycinamidine synthase subunit PurL [Candidatus Uhrbacteria bacterium]
MLETLDFSKLSPDGIKAILQKYRISLTPEEALKIQNEILKRPPTVSECILWSIQGSEHCSYKSSRKYLKQFITDGPNVILGPSEDAGIVEVARDNDGHRYGIVMSHESHNHPSQVVPYEGAATGIGGNVRDVSCMGAKVIANADPLRFGDINEVKSRWIHEGVVAGIAGYGNPIGVPVLAGDTYYDNTYSENCLVNVATLGVVRDDEIIHSKAPKNADGYDLILVGKATDNSGFGGAAFASGELDEAKKELNKGAVQEPNAFLKRHLLKSSYTLFKILKEKKLIDKVGLKDLGAGGIACAAVEIAESGGYGAEVNLDLVPISIEGLNPAVILCSETQERYLWACHPDVTPLILQHYNITFDLPGIASRAQATKIGKIHNDGQFIVTYKGEKIVDARACDVTQGLQYDREVRKPERTFSEPSLPELIYHSDTPAGGEESRGVHRSNYGIPRSIQDDTYLDIFLRILSHENIASREPIYEKYDKQVQGLTVIEPGEADAGVMQPFKDLEYPPEIRQIGIALSVDHNPGYCKIDPYQGGVNAVLEAARNVAATGAYPIAFTDCLNFGNPEKPEQMWEFVEGTRGVADAAKALKLKNHPDSPVPIISGNVSLYNESKGKPIAPSPVIACLGAMDDVSKAITMSFKKSDSLLFMIGERKDECGGSVYYSLFGELGKNVPIQDPQMTLHQIRALTEAISEGLVLSSHDISGGGIAVTLVEMAFGNEIGFRVTIPDTERFDILLWSETPGFVIEIDPLNETRVRDIFTKNDVSLFHIGSTTTEPLFIYNDKFSLELQEAKRAWKEGLRKKL